MESFVFVIRQPELEHLKWQNCSVVNYDHPQLRVHQNQIMRCGPRDFFYSFICLYQLAGIPVHGIALVFVGNERRKNKVRVLGAAPALAGALQN